jgi:hypothetical protein
MAFIWTAFNDDVIVVVMTQSLVLDQDVFAYDFNAPFLTGTNVSTGKVIIKKNSLQYVNGMTCCTTMALHTLLLEHPSYNR